MMKEQLLEGLQSVFFLTLVRFCEIMEGKEIDLWVIQTKSCLDFA